MDVAGVGRTGLRITVTAAVAGAATMVGFPAAVPAQAAEKYAVCYFQDQQTPDKRVCLTKDPFSDKSYTMRYWRCWMKQPSPRTHLRRLDTEGAWQQVRNSVIVSNGIDCTGASYPWSTLTEVKVQRKVGPIARYRFVLPSWSKSQADSVDFAVCVLPLKQAKDKSIPCGWTPTPEPTPTPTGSPTPTPTGSPTGSPTPTPTPTTTP